MDHIKQAFQVMGTDINKVFGSPITAPGPDFNNPVEGISRVFTTGIRLALVVAGVLVLIYMMWGAFEWITGGGEKEKLEAARQKMTNAGIGIILLVAMLGIFSVVTGDILGIIKLDTKGNWRFLLPRIGTCIDNGNICTPSSSVCCLDTDTCKWAAPTLSSGTGNYKCF
ncbi:hypothetical protein COV58_03510 [Candidatus Roizmanbacteria bacterium CG11_big_fil_rev_8_21_14_0_20_36_8]|uniref:Uncharacterized protein n=2 Tax=Candidatus Roizmaniibacteriota TaxID=1752723 RepID=A0A2M6ITN9_9BACT|nr:MAG: hypothetical protein COV58_03510 [Candidatus Roizmanbacteria bacterium CG11_big_fil_rev_8_21_14_0_20_36_8]PIZ65005.1 MAG: hypothetical protein COY14_03325 [Candidatus Roizmanbacteria bacterium CG_4_10_14_0_2_um_filter_36_9]